MNSMSTISFYLCLYMASLLSFTSAMNLEARDSAGAGDAILPRRARVHYVSSSPIVNSKRIKKLIWVLLQVQVGGANIFAYTPAFVFAHPGDTIHFEFLQANHTLTQSSFHKPCTPLPGGIDSGFKPNFKGERGLQVFKLKVPARKDPLWFYCQQGNHCGTLGEWILGQRYYFEWC